MSIGCCVSSAIPYLVRMEERRFFRPAGDISRKPCAVVPSIALAVFIEPVVEWWWAALADCERNAGCMPVGGGRFRLGSAHRGPARITRW